MAFADPQTITVATVAQTLALIGRDQSGSTFQKDDQAYKLSISHAKKTRTRHVMRIDFRKIAADPLVSANNVEYSGAVTLTLDVPNVGYSTTEQKDIVLALADYLKSSSNQPIIKLVAFE